MVIRRVNRVLRCLTGLIPGKRVSREISDLIVLEADSCQIFE